MEDILIATNNKGKVAEFKSLLADLPLTLKSLADYKLIKEVAETGKTFAENAEIKAKSYALQTNCRTIADDSGLQVDALDNAPGVFSARFAGATATDVENNEKLLNALTARKNRKARFVCVIAVSDANGKIIHRAGGICRGGISLQAAGNNGFGYDPVFIPEGFEKTFGELSGEIKKKISHRAKATRKILNFLQENS